MSVLEEARSFVNDFNQQYEAKHEAFENQFWGTKMALKDESYTAENLSKTKTEMENLLSDPTVLEKAQHYHKQLLEQETSSSASTDPALMQVLSIIVRTASCYTMPPAAKQIREATATLESTLEMARNSMTLGYTDPTTKEFVKASSVALRNTLSTEANEAKRQAAYEGLSSIGPFVLDHGFVEIIKQRNQLARALGFEDYYDYKVQGAEGFSKKRLFEMLDRLEQGTRPILEQARAEFSQQYGEEALQPWNMPFKMKGSIVAQMDPYFPFGKAVERYVQSYAAMKIQYQGATLNLDLLDRQNKYSNGTYNHTTVGWRVKRPQIGNSQVSFFQVFHLCRELFKFE